MMHPPRGKPFGVPILMLALATLAWLPAAVAAEPTIQVSTAGAVASAQPLSVTISVKHAPPGPAQAMVTVLLADWIPIHQEVALKVNQQGNGSTTVLIPLPSVRYRTSADIVVNLPGANRSRTTAQAKAVVIPPPSDTDIAHLAKDKSIGIFDPNQALQRILGLVKHPFQELRDETDITGFTGDIIALHTPVNQRITPEFSDAVADHLAAGRSVIWFVDKTQFSGERANKSSQSLSATWPFRLLPKKDLPNLAPGDLSHWDGKTALPAPFEACWPQARLIWAADLPLSRNRASAGPIAQWYVYDLLQRASQPGKPAGKPLLLQSSDNEASPYAGTSQAASLLRTNSRLATSRPVVLDGRAKFIAKLNQEVPEWTSRIKDFLDRGGRLLMLNVEPESLPALKTCGLQPPKLAPAPAVNEILLLPSPLLWGTSPPARETAQPLSVAFVIANPDGSHSLVQDLIAGKGKALLCQIKLDKFNVGEALLDNLLRTLALH
jgi:hypothetical protein